MRYLYLSKSKGSIKFMQEQVIYGQFILKTPCTIPSRFDGSTISDLLNIVVDEVIIRLIKDKPMKSLLEKKVLYISKQMVQIDTTQSKFFPFLASSIISSTAHQQITLKGIHAMCNWGNIKASIPHSKQYQQFVFFGRSNVGKSSLINSLVRKEFVETSKKPGKTKQLAFLKVKFPFETLLVDAPGYGYASDASKTEIMQWGRLIEYYLKNTPKDDKQIVMVLLDVMHGLKQTDGMLLNLLKCYSKKFMLVYTKCDRATEANFAESIEHAKMLQQRYKTMLNYVHYTSSRNGEGIAQLRNHILYRMATKQYLEHPGS